MGPRARLATCPDKALAWPLTAKEISTPRTSAIKLSICSHLEGHALFSLGHPRSILTKAPPAWPSTGSAICSSQPRSLEALAAATQFLCLPPMALKAHSCPDWTNLEAWLLTERANSL